MSDGEWLEIDDIDVRCASGHIEPFSVFNDSVGLYERILGHFFGKLGVVSNVVMLH